MQDLTVAQSLLSLLKTPEGVILISCFLIFWLLKFYFKNQKLLLEKSTDDKINELKDKFELQIHELEKNHNEKFKQIEIKLAYQQKK